MSEMETEVELESVGTDGRVSKEELRQRVEDVVELVVVGASFAEIRQFAVNMQWNVQDRQLYRYQEWAYKRLAKSLKRDSDQLMGRHLQQRRRLYSHSVRKDDCRMALQVLRDEANLYGLYPGRQAGKSIPPRSPMSLRERTIGLLVAKANGDKKQATLMEHVSMRREYRMFDTDFPERALKVLTLRHVGEQLDLAGIWMDAKSTHAGDVQGAVAGAKDPEWVAATTAFSYGVRVEAWRQFMQELGLDSGLLLKLHYRGNALGIYDRKICSVAPSKERMRELLDQAGMNDVRVVAAEFYVRSWWKEFTEACSGYWSRSKK